MSEELTRSNDLPMSRNIQKGDDGTYRWAYEFNMLKNPIILMTIWKVFFLVLLGMWLFFGLFGIRDYGLVGAYIEQAKALLIPAAILLVLSFVAYLILAGIYGWKYCVLFEMNEDGIRHIQMEKQFKKAQALGWLTAYLGAAAGNPGLTGTGLLSAAKNEMYTGFKNVKRLKSIRALHTIKLDAPFNHNQIYAKPEDFEFVLDYITKRI